VNYCFINYGNAKTVELLDALKELGFLYATKAGVSIGVDDMVIPARSRTIVESARKSVLEVERQRLDGAITHGERHNKIIDIWHRATEHVSDEMFSEMRRTEAERGEFNPIFMMADSGARGSKEQVRQLAGMRGLMSKPSGEVIETPITANFREGLSVLQYFISTHGARKGLADTALKTGRLRLPHAPSRRRGAGRHRHRAGLPDVRRHRRHSDHGRRRHPRAAARPHRRPRLAGRRLRSAHDRSARGAERRDHRRARERDQEAGIEQVKIRSVLTCETRRGVCRRCYGRNLASGKLVEIGEAVGVIAAESIGEPARSSPMRTFHVGGTASRVSEQSKHEATSPAACSSSTCRPSRTRTAISSSSTVTASC
jgi:DNA-directed RNA polymerase subunit beta'